MCKVIYCNLCICKNQPVKIRKIEPTNSLTEGLK